jgi:multiple sugar transport system permease protein
MSSVVRARRPGRAGLVARNRRFGALLATPATLLVVALVGVPALITLAYSFQHISFAGSSAFVGLQNYALLASSTAFQHAFGLTMVYALGVMAISTVLGLAFAVILNQTFHGRGLARTLLIVPWAVPWLLVGIIWKWFADADVGALNGLLYQVGATHAYIPFLASPQWALVLGILAASWRQASLSGLLLLAALQVIPGDLTEAAIIDGANAFQRFRYISLPWLRQVLVIVIITNVVSGFLQFDVIYALTEGGPGDATKLLSMVLYQQLFQFSNIGVGSAIAVVMGLVAFGIGLAFVVFLYREESAYAGGAA